MADWTVFQEKYRNSVVQICTTASRHSIYKPYLPGASAKSKGTGFFIDAVRGLVLTNHHVVDNALLVVCRVPKLGKVDVNMRMISYCREKDIALCQIYSEGLDLIKEKITPDLASLDLKFGDSLKIRETENVMAMGYPHGMDEIKLTVGTISGFNANVRSDGEMETEEDSPTYIVTQAPINPGNSGGPLFNDHGEVIGVNAAAMLFSQNTGYAIPSRTVQGILTTLLSPISEEKEAPRLGGASPLMPVGRTGGLPYIVRMPRTSFTWDEANDAMIKHLGVPEHTTGIVVKEIFRDTCLTGLTPQDFISAIHADITIPCNIPGSRDKCVIEHLEGKIDNYGDVSINSEEKKVDKRKLAFKEVMDMVPIGNTISLSVWREGVCYELKVPFTYVRDESKQPLRELSLHYEPIDYELYAGMIFVPLVYNFLSDNYEDLAPFSKGKKQYERFIAISEVLPGTEASRYSKVLLCTVVKSINGVKVRSIDELRSVVKSIPESGIFVLKNFNKTTFAITIEQMKREDASVAGAMEISKPSSEKKSP